MSLHFLLSVTGKQTLYSGQISFKRVESNGHDISVIHYIHRRHLDRLDANMFIVDSLDAQNSPVL